MDQIHLLENRHYKLYSSKALRSFTLAITAYFATGQGKHRDRTPVRTPDAYPLVNFIVKKMKADARITT